MFVSLYIHLPIYLSTCTPTCSSTPESTYPCIYLPIYIFTHISTHLPIYTPTSIYARIPISPYQLTHAPHRHPSISLHPQSTHFFHPPVHLPVHTSTHLVAHLPITYIAAQSSINLPSSLLLIHHVIHTSIPPSIQWPFSPAHSPTHLSVYPPQRHTWEHIESSSWCPCFPIFCFILKSTAACHDDNSRNILKQVI